MSIFNLKPAGFKHTAAGILTAVCVSASLLSGTVSVYAEIPTVAETITKSSSSVISPTSSSTSATTASGDNNVIVKTSSEKSTASLEESRRWIPTSTTNRTKEFKISVSSDVTRIEIFYTAGTSEPTLEFTDTSEKNKYTTAKNVPALDSDFQFLTKRLGAVKGYDSQGNAVAFDDMRLMVIYIAYPNDPGTWTLKVTMPDYMNELICVPTEVPEGWQGWTSDMKCLPTDLWFWYIGEKSQYYDDPFSAINQMWVADEELSGVDKMVSEEPETEVDVKGIVKMIVSLAFIVMLSVGFLLFLRKRNKDEEKRKKRQMIVDKENSKVKRRKAKENVELDKVLDDYSSEYIDSDEYSDYFNSVGGPEDESDTDYAITAESLGVATENNRPAYGQGYTQSNPYMPNPYGTYANPAAGQQVSQGQINPYMNLYVSTPPQSYVTPFPNMPGQGGYGTAQGSAPVNPYMTNPYGTQQGAAPAQAGENDNNDFF